MQPDFFIRCDGKFIRTDTRAIRYQESRKNYVRIVTTTKTWIVLITLRQLEQELPPEQFCRVHRSFIISLQHIQSFDMESVYLEDVTIPINPIFRNALPAKVKMLSCDRRSRFSIPS